jgi:argininosuccinate lyase
VIIMQLVINKLKVNAARCDSALTEDIRATEKVYQLVKQGMPFREAYRQIAKQYE